VRVVEVLSCDAQSELLAVQAAYETGTGPVVAVIVELLVLIPSSVVLIIGFPEESLPGRPCTPRRVFF
jgi:hypothetical protein